MRSPSAAAAAASMFANLLLQITFKLYDGFLGFEFREYKFGSVTYKSIKQVLYANYGKSAFINH